MTRPALPLYALAAAVAFVATLLLLLVVVGLPDATVAGNGTPTPAATWGAATVEAVATWEAGRVAPAP